MNISEGKAQRASTASEPMASAVSNGRRVTAGAQVHIERVNIIAEGVAGSDLQRHGERLAGDIGAILSSQVSNGRIRIGELSLRIAADQLNDFTSRERIARSVARRILDSLQD
jgi:hypothetical protein